VTGVLGPAPPGVGSLAGMSAVATRGRPAPDATLIDELPYAAANIGDAPEHIKAELCSTFDIQALYCQRMKQATIWATITDSTPGTVAALLTDPRTDSDTFGNLSLASTAIPTAHPCPVAGIMPSG
jgi:hypothetical protein